ncbi:MAG TPA: SGNH/GDSL hydrolase family protein [Steroidobacteraceae bacterium]|nr:SGNH/GDSL hydrolase family protein [Steroidobacteraceae bacterium]
MVERPCAAPLPMPASAHKLLVDMFMRPRVLGQDDFSALMGDRDFAAYNGELRRRAATDWAGLCRYQAANSAQRPGAARVVFIGDSITENWLLADPGFFTGTVVNRGIGAQTSAQMLVRFRADVVALRPAVVHILAGTNDVAGNNGPLRPRDFQNNIESMVEIARANGIRVILGSIPPSAAFNWQPALKPAPQIAALNEWMSDYARRNGLGYIDYHSALRGEAGELKPALGNDGVHPNRDGYAVMRRLAESAMAESLRAVR